LRPSSSGRERRPPPKFAGGISRRRLLLRGRETICCGMVARVTRKAEPVVDKNSAEDPTKAGRLKQIRMVASLVNQQNPKAMPIVFGSAAGIIVVFVLVGLLTNLAGFLIPLGLLLGL